MPLKECLNPECRQLHRGKGPRCPTCTAGRERARDQQRGNTTQRGYGWQHQQLRTQLLADNPLCAYCGQRPATHADHTDPQSNGGTAQTIEDYTPSCEHCNLSKGNNPTPKTKPQVTGGHHVSAGQTR